MSESSEEFQNETTGAAVDAAGQALQNSETAAEVASVSAAVSVAATEVAVDAAETASDALSTAADAAETAQEAKSVVEEIASVTADAFRSFREGVEKRFSDLESAFQKKQQDGAGEEDQSETATDDVEPEEIPVNNSQKPEVDGGSENGQQTATRKRHSWGR